MTNNSALPNLDEIKRRKLSEASAQEIQLELIRRNQFNAFEGEQMAQALLDQRHLWQAVFMDRLGVFNRAGRLPLAGMIKLRDLPDNIWNVDTLYLLVEDREKAKELVKALDFEELGGMVTIHEDRQEVDNALGGGRDEPVIVAVWWD